MVTFKSVDLFGGTIVTDLPSPFADVSHIRPVPNNQEVFLDQDGFSSIAIDITERVNSVSTDEAALTFHFEDIVEGAEGIRVWSSNAVHFSKLPEGTPAFTLFATQRPISTPRASPPTVQFTGIVMTLIRLEGASTDIVITINVPHRKGEYAEADVDLEHGKLGKDLEVAILLRDQVLRTFEIKDWSLFVQEA
ncbi:MAG: hypothetical protein M1827_000058 [Pycnora praestabilis]|nr:MAG: hypothetical protein M1827_000058 [Pycnora praestabilis]